MRKYYDLSLSAVAAALILSLGLGGIALIDIPCQFGAAAGLASQAVVGAYILFTWVTVLCVSQNSSRSTGYEGVKRA